ncbi:MAG TPA: substrate-binding domain-containing protein [Fimbriimonas sp.]|nr:substrate-binding domain-containing protein [Fimbriimonas sp.]
MKKTLFALLAISLLASACNRGGEEGSAGAANNASGGKKLKIVFIPKQSGNAYFDEVDKGFKEAANELKCDYSMVAPASGDATSQIPVIKAQIQEGVDVIALSANSPDALNEVLDQAKAKGITVVTVDADLMGNEAHRDAAVLQADPVKVGESELALMGKLINNKGDFAILSATADAPNQNAWIAAMKDALKQPKYVGMHLVATVYGDDEPQKSTAECEGLLSKYPDLRGILAPTSKGLPACAQTVERSGVFPKGPHAKGDGIQVTGLSTPTQMKKYIDKGEVTAFQLWEPANMGYLAVYVGSQIHDGKLKPDEGAEITTPKFGKQKFAAKQVLYGGDLITFDKSNIDKYNF